MQFTMNMDERLHQRLKLFAAKSGETMTEIITRSIEAILQRAEKKDSETKKPGAGND